MTRRLGFITGLLVVVTLMAGCTSLGSYRGRIEAARASLKEAKMAGAKETAPDEYAKAEACLEGAWHSATTFCHDARVERYLQCAEQNVKLALRKAKGMELAKPVAPPVPGVGPAGPGLPPEVSPPPVVEGPPA
ncbi:MAG: DUF4398 domain-containing protein, partial [candidate division NC10 bacterium]|nr:DUF4398 domain-containing protein [candidate division NC10 bacterium]